MNYREELKLQLMRERPYCEGQMFKVHICKNGTHMNEVFYKKNDCKTSAQKKYINNKRNISIVCGWFHENYGHSREFTECFAGIQAERFSDLAEYLECAPFKIKISLASMMPEDYGGGEV